MEIWPVGDGEVVQLGALSQSQRRRGFKFLEGGERGVLCVPL